MSNNTYLTCDGNKELKQITLSLFAREQLHVHNAYFKN